MRDLGSDEMPDPNPSANRIPIPDPGTRLKLRLYRRLIDQHDRDVVFDRVHALALSALERRAVLHQLNLGLAVRAGKYLEQFLIDRHERLHFSRERFGLYHLRLRPQGA